MGRTRPDELTAQQIGFIDHYVVDRNATQAAIKAGYSPATAGSQGSRLLKNQRIKVEIAHRLSRVSARIELSAANTLEELRRLMHLDPAKVYGPDGSMLPVPDMPPEIRACISAIEVEEIYEGTGAARKLVGKTTKVRFWSKPTALIGAMKHFDLIAAAGLTVQLRTDEQEKKAASARDQLNQLLERQRHVWHGDNVVPIKANGTNGHGGNGAAS